MFETKVSENTIPQRAGREAKKLDKSCPPKSDPPSVEQSKPEPVNYDSGKGGKREGASQGSKNAEQAQRIPG